MKGPNLYTSCDDLPLNLFIRCVVDHDLQALIIYGDPSVEDVAEAWANIYAEYLDLNEDNEGKYLLNLQKEIWLLNQNIIEVKSVVQLLRLMYHEELVAILRYKNYDQALDFEDRDAYVRDLMVIENSLAAEILQKEIKEQEVTDYVRSRGNDTLERKYFNKMLIRISKHMGYGVKAKETTVTEFVNMINDLLQVVESKKQPDGDEG
jgi:Zn-dependent M32 family carboxypeptidase